MDILFYLSSHQMMAIWAVYNFGNGNSACFLEPCQAAGEHQSTGHHHGLGICHVGTARKVAKHVEASRNLEGVEPG